MHKENLLSPSSVRALFQQCEREGVGTPHTFHLNRYNGTPVSKNWRTQPLSLSEAIEGLSLYDLALIPASINTIVFETCPRASVPIEIMLAEYRTAFKAVSNSSTNVSGRGYAWAHCLEIDQITDREIWFRDQVAGMLRGAGGWIRLSDHNLHPLLEQTTFWSEDFGGFLAADLSELKKLPCSFYDLLNDGGGTGGAFSESAIRIFLNVHDRGQIRQMDGHAGNTPAKWGARYDDEMFEYFVEMLD